MHLMSATLVSSVILGAPLGTDSAALCTGIGAGGRLTMRRRLTIAGTLTAFEAGMPVVGVLLSSVIGDTLGDSARWAGGALLIALGIYMLINDEGRPVSDDGATTAPIGIGGLIVAGLAVSVDEIAVGVSLGLGGVNLPVLVSTIGVIVFGATMAGLTLGVMLARHAERAGSLAAYALMILGALLAVGIL
jgi:putative Mn2+ efflux pump MntP